MEQGSKGLKVLKILVPAQLHRDLKMAAARDGETLQSIGLEALVASPRLKKKNQSDASAPTREHELPGGGTLHVKHVTAGELAANPPCTHPRGKLSALGNGRYMCRDCRAVISPTHPERM